MVQVFIGNEQLDGRIVKVARKDATGGLRQRVSAGTELLNSSAMVPMRDGKGTARSATVCRLRTARGYEK